MVRALKTGAPDLDLTPRARILQKGVNMGVFEGTDIVTGRRAASTVITNVVYNNSNNRFSCIANIEHLHFVIRK